MRHSTPSADYEKIESQESPVVVPIGEPQASPMEIKQPKQYHRDTLKAFVAINHKLIDGYPTIWDPITHTKLVSDSGVCLRPSRISLILPLARMTA